jgi:5-methylcytosine-specific restriction endonuclease McrA
MNATFISGSIPPSNPIGFAFGVLRQVHGLGGGILLESEKTMKRKASTQEIIDAYQKTGSVWKAAKKLGMSGQTIHERLKAAGYKIIARKWSKQELAELKNLVNQIPINEIAKRLGRPYNGVAAKISRLGMGTRFGNQGKVKTPRISSYNKKSTLANIDAITIQDISLSRFARQNGLSVELLIQSFERWVPEWWKEYRQKHSSLKEIMCSGCGQIFTPSNTRQIFHSRQCGYSHRSNIKYFGGKRNNTVGLSEGICQICGRHVNKGLSAHHIFGKLNDPENKHLIALCPGCHHTLGMLGGRTFVNDPKIWEKLITFAWIRKNAKDNIKVTVKFQQPNERRALQH